MLSNQVAKRMAENGKPFALKRIHTLTNFSPKFLLPTFLGEQLRQSGDDIVFCGFTDSKVTEDTESTGVLCYASI